MFLVGENKTLTISSKLGIYFDVRKQGTQKMRDLHKAAIKFSSEFSDVDRFRITSFINALTHSAAVLQPLFDFHWLRQLIPAATNFDGNLGNALAQYTAVESNVKDFYKTLGVDQSLFISCQAYAIARTPWFVPECTYKIFPCKMTGIRRYEQKESSSNELFPLQRESVLVFDVNYLLESGADTKTTLAIAFDCIFLRFEDAKSAMEKRARKDIASLKRLLGENADTDDDDADTYITE